MYVEGVEYISPFPSFTFPEKAEGLFLSTKWYYIQVGL